MQATNTTTEQIDIWIVFEDQELLSKINGKYFNEILRKLNCAFDNKQISFPDVKKVQSFAEALVQKSTALQHQLQRLPKPDMSEINMISFFSHSLLKVSKEFLENIPVPLGSKLNITVLSLNDYYRIMFSSGSPENPSFVAWVLDTDGLDLVSDQSVFPASGCRTQFLNRSNSVLSESLAPFINIQSNSTEALSGSESYLSCRQGRSELISIAENSSQFFKFSHNSSRSLLENSTEVGMGGLHGSDHFVLFFNPNLEYVKFSRNSEAEIELMEALGTEKIGEDLFYSDMASIKRYIRPSLLTSDFATRPPIGKEWRGEHIPRPMRLHRVKFKQASEALVLKQFLKGSELRFHSSIDRDQTSRMFLIPQPMLPTNVTLCGIYLGKGRENKNHRKSFPIKLKTTTPFGTMDFESSVSPFKYTFRFDPTESMDAELVHNPKGIVKLSRQIVWSPPNRCNGRTKIHYDQLSKDKQQRFLRLFGYGYAGFKPCERFVKGQLRCRDHQP